MKLVCVGDNCMDAYPALGRAFPGGNAVNVAVIARRLGTPSAYVGFVGEDAYGERMRSALADEGVNVSHLHTRPGRTAVTQVELKDGERVFGDYDEGVLANFTLAPDDLSFIEGFGGVHSGYWGKCEAYYPPFKRAGMSTSFDFADHLESPLFHSLLPHLDYAFVSHGDEDEALHAFLPKALAQGPQAVIATLGERGSIAIDKDGLHRAGIVPVQVVDTMGAGDAYIAGFLACRLAGGSLDEAMGAGAASASRAITYFGAW